MTWRDRTAARNRTVEAAFQSTTIGAFVDAAAAKYGTAMAIEVFERNERATYRDVKLKSDAIGCLLKDRGIGKGDRVAVMLPNCLAYPLIWIALAKIGAVHVPINTRYTPAEISFAANDAGIRFAFVDADLSHTFLEMPERPATLPDDAILVVNGSRACGPGRLETALSQIDAHSCLACLDPTVTPHDLMNIQYTSGTTGFPKGCMLSHEYWLILAHAAQAWDHDAPRRLLSAQPYFYMDPQWITLKTFMNGGTLVIAPGLSASRYLGWIKAHAIEWCLFPLLMARREKSGEACDTALIQVATFGWPPDICRDFKRRFGTVAREGFGMTEIGLGTWMLPEFCDRFDSGSVGFAAPFRETSVRDDAGQPVEPGGTGELWVRGRALFQGYWNRPDANREAFEDGGWFRTGDLFQIDEDGFLYLVGRLKDMIRRSQENIAAREVEAVLCLLPDIEEAACVPVPDAIRGEEVKAYIQLKPDRTPADCPPERILEHCSSKLAAFKVPRFIAFIEGLPKTPSNKVAKRTLVEGEANLRAGSFDAQKNRWLSLAEANDVGTP